MLLSRIVVGISSMVLAGLSVMALGQDYPNKAIRIITAAAGGGSDFAARQIAQGITGPLGQPVVVDNRGSIVIAIDPVAKAPSDGYTLLVGGSTLWVNPLLQKVSWDMFRDFTPISQISRDVLVLAVHPSLPVKSVQELIALAKARPGELNYSSGGAGTTPHLSAELLKSLGKINIVGVAYRGGAASVTALISGEVQLTINDLGLVMPQVKSGKLRALAVTSATPSALAPGLPTIAASGLPNYEAVGMTHIIAPAKTPEAIINRLNQEIVRVLNRPEVKERFFNVGTEVITSSPEQFAATIRADVDKWDKVVKEAGIKLN